MAASPAARPVARFRLTPPTAASCRTTPPRLLAKTRSEEHTSELQSQSNIVCRLLLEKKKSCHNSAAFLSSAFEAMSNPTSPPISITTRFYIDQHRGPQKPRYVYHRTNVLLEALTPDIFAQA